MYVQHCQVASQSNTPWINNAFIYEYSINNYYHKQALIKCLQLTHYFCALMSGQDTSGQGFVVTKKKKIMK